MNQTRQLRLTGRASRLIQMLTDFGHLDPVATDSLLVALSDRYGAQGQPALVDLPQIRPMLATILADNPSLETGPLAEDWGPLFH